MTQSSHHALTFFPKPTSHLCAFRPESIISQSHPYICSTSVSGTPQTHVFIHTPTRCLHTSSWCTPHNSWCTFAHPPLETSQVYYRYITYPLTWSIDRRVLSCTTFGDSCSILLTPNVTQTIWFRPVDQTPGTGSQPPDPPVTIPNPRTPPFLRHSTCTSRLTTSTEKLPEGNPSSS